MSDANTSPHRIDGAVAVVTGAAQGLGLRIAQELSREGARTVIADLQLDKATQEAERLRGEELNVEARSLDVTDSTKVNVFFERVAADHGRVDVLVNSAGTFNDVSPIVDLRDEEWDRVLRVNLTGTFHCCRAAGAIMERQESGAIVNLSSINGQSPSALVAPYNVSKAGVISLSRTLALEMAAYGVRVNAVCPGPVYTDFNHQLMAQRAETLDITRAEMVERVRKSIPLGRWGEPEDVAHMVAFLCSPAAAWITGEVLTVSGGLGGVSATPPKRQKKT